MTCFQCLMLICVFKWFRLLIIFFFFMKYQKIKVFFQTISLLPQKLLHKLNILSNSSFLKQRYKRFKVFHKHICPFPIKCIFTKIQKIQNYSYFWYYVEWSKIYVLLTTFFHLKANLQSYEDFKIFRKIKIVHKNIDFS